MLPSMIMLVLCMMQLTMVQHARIMTEYAAFCAARAGIVFNADRAAMERAATLALLPTMGRFDDMRQVAETSARVLSIERGMRVPLPILQLTVLQPTAAAVRAANVTRHLNNEELDFDDVRPAAARLNQLQLRVRYFYKMSVPFANWMLQAMWFAQRGTFASAMQARVGQMTPEGYVTAARAEAAMDANLQNAAALVGAAMTGRYYFPVEATYTMRMQSNLYLGNLP